MCRFCGRGFGRLSRLGGRRVYEKPLKGGENGRVLNPPVQNHAKGAEPRRSPGIEKIPVDFVFYCGRFIVSVF